VLADKAYSSKANRAYLRRRKIGCTIPVKDDQAANDPVAEFGQAARVWSRRVR